MGEAATSTRRRASAIDSRDTTQWSIRLGNLQLAFGGTFGQHGHHRPRGAMMTGSSTLSRPASLAKCISIFLHPHTHSPAEKPSKPAPSEPPPPTQPFPDSPLRKQPGQKRTTSHQAGGGTRGPRPKRQAGTVSALRLLPALTVPDSITDASQLCAAKRTDCVLVVDEDEHLRRIFTAKDLAFRVIGDGMDPHTTPVLTIMTRNPMVTIDTTLATEALTTMVTRGFRHLSVCHDEGDVIGLLDVTKVFPKLLEKLERACCSSEKLYDPIEGVQSEFGNGTRGATPGAVNPLMVYVEALRNKISFPDLGLILDARKSAATVGVKTSVKEATILMRIPHHRRLWITGMFTSKDIVLRVIAAGFDAHTCSFVRVMTPHPRRPFQA
ncbi:hypothetical protein PTTG_08048 [Puccinia triticina 1-1 BBBD Race 1]|uniref:CBS domain-containing protein n=1 Tax=Puccinia triticina (isolate 1-1 / race 1 (BBBD)) TaxID=630390 RepID=A0A180GKW9_PUCT1|nr:hypothetical protein PTTG_08048 [Puccinia triticina 1-1 BBBD Race 1]